MTVILKKKHVDQLRYQLIIEIEKDPIQNKTDIIKNQLDKPLSMLSLPDHLPLSTSELESHQEHQDISIQNCSQHSKDKISYPIVADTTREPSNYELNEDRPERTRTPPANLKGYLT